MRKLVSRKEFKALAVSSASIALSIGSAFANTHLAPRDRAASLGGESGWRTAYAAARMSVEIAKESFDIIPSLKAVSSVASVLIQNFDVSVSCPWTE